MKLKEAYVGEWIDISPENAMSIRGEKWTGYLRVGREAQNVIVCFYGGGVAMNEQFYKLGFYMPEQADSTQLDNGLCSKKEENPFHDWSVVAVPYSTGDLHIGRGEYVFEENTVCRFNGYNNYRGLMDEAVKYLGNSPEKLLVTGFSAGGFAAAFLTEDILRNYFTEAKNVTAFIDSAVTVYGDWITSMTEYWNAPDEIVARAESDDITYDMLKALSNECPNVKLLFSCSTRDLVLGAVQNLIVNNDSDFTEAGCDLIENDLKNFTSKFTKLPNTAVYMWNDLITGGDKGPKSMTEHTISIVDFFFTRPFGGNKQTIAEWLMNSYDGVLDNLGLDAFN